MTRTAPVASPVDFVEYGDYSVKAPARADGAFLPAELFDSSAVYARIARPVMNNNTMRLRYAAFRRDAPPTSRWPW